MKDPTSAQGSRGNMRIATSTVRLILPECRETSFGRRKAPESSFKGHPAFFHKQEPLGQKVWPLRQSLIRTR